MADVYEREREKKTTMGRKFTGAQNENIFIIRRKHLCLWCLLHTLLKNLSKLTNNMLLYNMYIYIYIYRYQSSFKNKFIVCDYVN